MAPIKTLDGAERQQAATSLWSAWKTSEQTVVILSGVSGAGKSFHVVRPLMKRVWGAKGIALSIEVPSSPVDLESHLLGLLKEECEELEDYALRAAVQRAEALFPAIRALLRKGAMVVVDEFQRLLDASGRPQSLFVHLVDRLARGDAGPGSLWLVSNRVVSPAWAHRFTSAELPVPQEDDAIRMVLAAIGGTEADAAFPEERRSEVVTRLGRNPRVLTLLGHLLRHQSLEELLGPAEVRPQAPPSMELVRYIEEMLLNKAMDRLPPWAREALRDLTVLADWAEPGLVQAVIGTADHKVVLDELRNRYLVRSLGRSSRPAGHSTTKTLYQVYPLVREVHLLKLSADDDAWRAAHRRAGSWFAKAITTPDSFVGAREARVAVALSGVQFHYTQAKADTELAAVVAKAHFDVEVRYGQEYLFVVPESTDELSARISLLDAYFAHADNPRVHSHQARLLQQRDAPGDLAKAVGHAERSTEALDSFHPWILRIKLVRAAQGVSAALDVGREALDRGGKITENRFAVYAAIAMCLTALGRVPQAIKELHTGFEQVKPSDGFRLAEAALAYAAAEPTDKELDGLDHWLSGLRGMGNQATLAKILLAMRRDRWPEVVSLARSGRRKAPKYLHFAVYEAVGSLALDKPGEAQEALTSFPGGIPNSPRLSRSTERREGKAWLAALVALQNGDLERARTLLDVYLGVENGPLTAGAVKARLLHEWDHRIATMGEANPSFVVPVLPRAVTGLPDDAVRPQYGAPVLPQHQQRVPAETGRTDVLVVATEWSSGKGGLSTFNRRMCRALAKAGAGVYCLVPAFTGEEYADAAGAGVTLVQAKRSPGTSDLDVLTRKPVLPEGIRPRLIIGHGRITGPAAHALAADHFGADDHHPAAEQVHVLHMSAEEIEWYKTDREDDAGDRAAKRSRIEIDLARSAAHAVAVGPRLYDRYLKELAARGSTVERFDPGFDTEQDVVTEPPAGKRLRVLLFGRAEDESLKGLDLAAAAFAKAVRYRGPTAGPVELVVRGADQDTCESLRTKMIEWSGSKSGNIVVRPYSIDPAELAIDLRTANLALMPSRSEGFGLVGAEAIAMGVPALISGESGLGTLLREFDEEVANQVVVPVTHDDDEDAEAWARAIQNALFDPKAAFTRAQDLRVRLVEDGRTWDAAATALLRALTDPAT
ncbi:glycosyltransferase [Actinosynnema sp. NPDC023587]|uniref:glycosyltransferase n=1 Tax=Actinosynnema sp. NPDC023587 TaxID=3154695 RepID=UPI0033D63481